MAVESKKQRLQLIGISIVASLGGLLFGYNTAIISSIMLFIRQDYLLDINFLGWIVGIISLGACVGALISGPLADKWGRRTLILTSSIIFVFSALILSWSPSPNWILIGRFLVGIAIGIAAAMIPIYISEIVPKSLRGALVTINQLSITVGILIAYLIGYAFSSFEGWRLSFAIAFLPSIFQFFILFRCPETPRWLFTKGKLEEAKKILLKYRGSVEDVDKEFSYLQEQTTSSKNYGKAIRRSLWTGIGLTIIQQITGINAIIYYAPTIFQMMDFANTQSAIFVTIFIGIINVIATVVSLSLIDKIGRKPLLYIGLSGMTVTLFFLALGNHLIDRSLFLNWVAVFSMVTFVAFYALSLGTCGWLIISEIYPLKIRGKAMGLTTAINWIANFILTLFFLSLADSYSLAFVFYLLTIISFIGIWFIVFFIPETKDTSLEEIEKQWRE